MHHHGSEFSLSLSSDFFRRKQGELASPEVAFHHAFSLGFSRKRSTDAENSSRNPTSVLTVLIENPQGVFSFTDCVSDFVPFHSSYRRLFSYTTTTACTVGKPSTMRDKEACYRDYEQLVRTQSYVDFQNALLAPNADTYVRRLIQQSPQAREDIEGKLAVVTGVSCGSVGFHVAQELALQCDMHVILLGKSATNLERCVMDLEKEARQRKLPDPKVYTHKYKLASLQSVKEAADSCKTIAAKCEYSNHIAVLVNAAAVGSNEARLTEEDIEYNTGCNFVATHCLTQMLVPLLLGTATETYKPRVVLTSSIGHVFGRKFNPSRLVKNPEEGGAPEGYIVWNERIGSIEEYQPPEKPTERLWRMIRNEPPPDPDWQRVGTQVGRSKMAILANAVHMARIYPQLCITSHHPGSIKGGPNAIGDFSNLLENMHRYSPSQGARAALRAAIDPDFNAAPELNGGIYLHCDGNPWHPFQPEARNPTTGERIDWETYCAACFQAAENLLEDLGFLVDQAEENQISHDPVEEYEAKSLLEDE